MSIRWCEIHGMRNQRGAYMIILAGFMQRVYESSELAQSLIRYADQHYAMDYDITTDERGALVELWIDGRWHVSIWPEPYDPDTSVRNAYAGDYIGANDYANVWIYGDKGVE